MIVKYIGFKCIYELERENYKYLTSHISLCGNNDEYCEPYMIRNALLRCTCVKGELLS
jgi:hypothetical protein